MPLSALLSPDSIVLNIEPCEKNEILDKLTKPLVDMNIVNQGQKELFLEQLIKREELCSTGLEAGVAVPHPRMPMPGLFPKPHVVFGHCPKGMDFDALDGKPIHHFFLICVSRDDIHLRLLTKISKVVRFSGLPDITETTKPDEIISFIKNIEKKMENQ